MDNTPADTPTAPTPPTKKKRRKKKKRCVACRKRVASIGITLECTGCGRTPLCLGCVAPARHDCTHDWAATQRVLLAKQLVPAHFDRLPDRL